MTSHVYKLKNNTNASTFSEGVLLFDLLTSVPVSHHIYSGEQTDLSLHLQMSHVPQDAYQDISSSGVHKYVHDYFQ